MSDNWVDAWEHGSNLDYLVKNVLKNGVKIDSRYGRCIEILGGRLRCRSGSLITRRNINYSLGWMEMYQLLAGVYDPAALARVAPNANHSLFTYDMAYGPRVVDQIPGIIEALVLDPNTRQAVVFVGKPENGPTSSLPCTISIQFLIRENLLHAVVNMRSWDLCRGLPYDIMLFSGLLEVIARCISLETGNLTVCAGSTHIYMDQIDKKPKLRNTRWSFTEEVPDSWYECVEWFRQGINTIGRQSVPDGIMYSSLI